MRTVNQAYARDPISQSGCRGLRPGHKGVLSRHVFYLNFSQYAKGAVRPTPPSGARGRSLLSTTAGTLGEEEEENMDLEEGQRAANYSAVTSFHASSVPKSVGSPRRKQGQRRRRLHSDDAPSSAAQRRRQLLANSRPSPRGGGGGGRSASSTDPSQVAHMNVIRDPVSRCVSRFYYERDARGVFPHDYTLDECMAPNGRCAFNRWVVVV